MSIEAEFGDFIYEYDGGTVLSIWWNTQDKEEEEPAVVMYEDELKFGFNYLKNAVKNKKDYQKVHDLEYELKTLKEKLNLLPPSP